MPLPASTWLLAPSHVGALSSLESRPRAAGVPTYQLNQGVAIIQCCGLMLVSGDDWWGPEGIVSTSSLRSQLRHAAANPAAKSILYVVSSGGGEVAGTLELAEDVRAAAAVKPVFSFVQDAAASAAYWAASQASKIYASQLAKVGSIGAYHVAIDSTAAAAKAGLTVHLVKSGPHKAAGFPGTPLTPEYFANQQTIVDRIHETFVAAVAAGRGLTPKAVQASADGRVFLPDQAMRAKLIDGVSTLDATFAALVQLTSAGSTSPPAVPRLSNPRSAMSAAEQIEELVKEKMERNPRLTRPEAMQQVCKENEELRAEWCQKYTAEHMGKVNRARQ